MSDGSPSLSGTSGPRTGVPSNDGLRLILTGIAYLLAICVLQLVVVVSTVVGRPEWLPPNVVDIRDVVALFGWVGLTISGVSVIIVPNHLGVRVRPVYLPRLHLVLANVGLVGYLASSISLSFPRVPYVLLAVTSASFLLFGVGVLCTVLAFVRHPLGGRRPGPAAMLGGDGPMRVVPTRRIEGPTTR